MKKLTDEDGEVREITKEDIKHFKPAHEVDPDFVNEMKRLQGQRGAQKQPTKTPVTLRIDPDIVEWFKADGKGYQSRINQALRDHIKTQ